MQVSIIRQLKHGNVALGSQWEISSFVTTWLYRNTLEESENWKRAALAPRHGTVTLQSDVAAPILEGSWLLFVDTEWRLQLYAYSDKLSSQATYADVNDCVTVPFT